VGWYILKRLGHVIVTFFLLLTFSYALIEAMPGDFGQAFLANPDLTAEQREALRRTFGLDRPPHERFALYMGALLRGDLGISFSNFPRPVLDIIAERAPRTIVLFLTATVVSFYVGFFVGKILAWRRGRSIEYVTTVGGVMLYTVFLPWFALMLIWLLAYTLDLFPIGKFITPTVWRRAPVEANVVFEQMLLTALLASSALLALQIAARRAHPSWRKPAQWGALALVIAGVLLYWVPSGLGRYALNILHHLSLPVLTLTLINFAGTMLLTRNSMLETLREDYITTARAKGLPDHVIRDRHAARNAMLPVVTTFVFSLAAAIGGGVLTETVFSWPGMGSTLIEAAQVQDVPMIMGGLVFVGSLTLLAHLVADVLYALLDPRIRYT
jgi:peptide/nickel transport system permease protein